VKPDELVPPADGGPLTTDVVIVGAGAAGLYLAARLPEGLDVVVVDKGGADPDPGSSSWAQAGLAAAVGPGDDPDLHVVDTLAAGDGLCDPIAVETLAREAPGHVHLLFQRGARFDHDGQRFALAREGGQQVARSVRRADATGAELIRVLRELAAPRVSRLGGIARRLARDETGRVTGLWVAIGDGLVGVRARAVVLATGGCGALYAATTNTSHATGDGLALAADAGAALRDIEFVQFHPTALAVGDSRRFLLTEGLRGAGATLHDADGRRFLADVHPDAELAPRHVVANAILDLPEGTAWLDATGLSAERLAAEFPTALAGAAAHGFALGDERVPVSPAAHYHMGGVRTDLDGRTSVHGLYACGEVASTGVHGANRLAGNSLSEALVFGARTATALAADLPERLGELGDAPPVGEVEADVPTIAAAMREAMLGDAGPVREGEGLVHLDDLLARWIGELGHPGPDVASVQLAHALRASQLLVRAATLRTESRGGHRRADFPARSAMWDGVHLELVAGAVTLS
jgi:L-aspartate oxidase